jgi:GDSL-like lipase/acylhydrolase family protein
VHSRSGLRTAAIQFVILLITLGTIELALQWLNLTYLRLDDLSRLGYQHDAEIGWSPIPNSIVSPSMPSTITVRHNSIGLRDDELQHDSRPTILFLGDSFVWGFNVDNSERFTELLRPEFPDYRIVNAGVAGYGTDQAYLLARRIWDAVKPDIVVLMFCSENDRRDNSSNLRGGFKPYLHKTVDGVWEFAGLPPPKARSIRFRESSMSRFMLARAAISGYVELRYPRITVPDPTDRLIGMLREFVEARGARLVVGMTRDDPELQTFLRNQGIPQVSIEGGEAYYDSTKHWTLPGHQLAAGRLLALLRKMDDEPRMSQRTDRDR